MRADYIIIQAGGKGTRLKHLTRNKPKGIVPVNNLPIIFHLFRRYPKKKYIIIGDYLHSVLEGYLEAFGNVRYITVKAEGTGTCAGIRDAVSLIPEGEAFILTWSDLILSDAAEPELVPEGNYIGISKDFECRWSFEDGKFVESPSCEHGVAGYFIFKEKSCLLGVPEEGEFVRWLGKTGLSFEELPLTGTKEIGTLLAMAENSSGEYRCRPFNSLEITGETIVKRPVDEQGRKLAVREIQWYREVQKYGFKQIPKLYCLEPLTMGKIDGVNIFRADLTTDEKKIVIDHLVESLERLHGLKKVPADCFSIMEAYYHKTMKRLAGVRDLIPFADREYIRINGKNCRNPYFQKARIRELVEKLVKDCREFALLHGDCTFSNTMIDKNLNIVFLDPRGYFGYTELYGDVYYDWAKAYYSICGDYDQFNNGKFSLDIGDSEVSLQIETNGWKEMGDYYLSRIHGCDPEQIRFLHAIIWLSLTTYAWEDYDSICGAFYNGTYLMEEFL